MMMISPVIQITSGIFKQIIVHLCKFAIEYQNCGVFCFISKSKVQMFEFSTGKVKASNLHEMFVILFVFCYFML